MKLVNTSDSDIATAFISDTNQDAVVTWKPMVSQIAKTKGVTKIFDSSKIPGEIRGSDGGPDRHPEPAGWVRSAFRQSARWSLVRDHEADDRNGPGDGQSPPGNCPGSEDTLASYKEMLSTTHLFDTPQSAATFTTAPDFQQKMNLVRQFCFSHGLLGETYEIGR